MEKRLLPCIFMQAVVYYVAAFLQPPGLVPKKALWPSLHLGTGRPRQGRLSFATATTTEHDVIVIGSGVGGLSCASLLAKHGLNVAVCESHDAVGGAAHAFEVKGFKFDSGPSLFSGFSVERSPSPLKHILDFVDQKVEWLSYDTWGVVIPEGSFDAKIGPEPFRAILKKFGGPQSQLEWDRLMEYMVPLGAVSQGMPPAALRKDLGALLTMGRYLKTLLKTIAVGPKLQLPFHQVLDQLQIHDCFIRRWLSLLCFLLQGMPEGTPTAVMAYMLKDWYDVGILDYPKGGTGAICEALARGVTATGGQVYLSAHVEQIVIENSRAVGVRLKDGRTLWARRGICSNASVWNTRKLLQGSSVSKEYLDQMTRTPQTPSFLHLHLGIDADGLPPIWCHYAVVEDWERGITSPGNVVIISIPSVLDPSLAPPNAHVVHAYTAGNEPYDLWNGLDRRSSEYRQLKEERSQILWRALEKVIPDIRKRAKVTLAGTPLTHERFLRRDRGTYGPAITVGKDKYPDSPPIEGLVYCGDSQWPGIGIPSVAASGNLAANSFVSVRRHWRQLDSIKLP